MYATESEIEFAEKHGWLHIKSEKTGSNFQRGYTYIWYCRDGWQCADLVDNTFVNHRGLKKDITLKILLEEKPK